MKKQKERLTSLNNKDAEIFLKKYEKIMFLESNKRSQITGIGTEDLVQMCREKLLEGFSSYDANKSAEKTWAVHVIKNTLNGIWKTAIKKKRVNIAQDEFGNSEPVRDISLSETTEYSIKISDRHPVYGTKLFQPDEYLNVLEALNFLKTNLPQESYELIKESLLPELEKEIPTTKKSSYKLKNPKDYKIWSIFSGMKETEIQILSQIADFFINVLGFDKKALIKRTKTIDIIFPE